MNNIQVVNFATGELTELSDNCLAKLMEVYEAAKAKRDETYVVMETIKMLLIQKSQKSHIDPTRLTRRIQGDGVTAILKENPKIEWDESLLSKAKRILGKNEFSKFFREKTEFKPQYRELNKLPHTVAPDKNVQKAYKIMLDARKPTGQSSFYLAWEKAKNG